MHTPSLMSIFCLNINFIDVLKKKVIQDKVQELQELSAEIAGRDAMCLAKAVVK